MEYEDRITIWAPEGLALEYTLAGFGSRFIAELVDIVLRVIVLAAVLAGLSLVDAPRTITLIVVIIGGFLALFAYDVAFEVWAAGRTPGKRWNGLRVLMADGQPVTFGPSAVRNLLRVIDIWATAMIAGATSIIVTKRNQRLGDLAAATIVVRERRAQSMRFDRAGFATVLTAQPSPVANPVPTAIDVTAISASELAAIRDFLARRDRLAKDARARVARTLADAISPRVGGLPPNGLAPEPLLETVAAAKAASGYGSDPSP